MKQLVFALFSSGMLIGQVNAGADSIASPASCFGKPVKKVDLSTQFGPSKNQIGGLCYSYASVAALEAAAYRTDGVRRDISAEYTASKAFEQGDNKSASTRFSDFRENIKTGYYLDGGTDKNTMSALLKMPYYATSDAYRKEYKKMDDLQSGDVKSHFEDGGEGGNPITNGLAEIMTAAVYGTENSRKSQWANLDLTRIVQHYDQSNKPKIHIATQGFKVNSLSGYSDESDAYLDAAVHIHDSKGKAVLRPPHTTPANCGPSNPKVKNNLEQIMKNLCAGIPVVAGVRLVGTKMVNIGDGDKDPTTTKIYVGSDHGNHAMIIQGIEMVDGQPNIVFRNSWKNGSAETPAKSLAYIPFSDACKIYSATVMTTPNDPDVNKPDTTCQLPKGGSGEVSCKNIEYIDEGSGGSGNEPVHQTSQNFNLPSE